MALRGSLLLGLALILPPPWGAETAAGGAGAGAKEAQPQSEAWGVDNPEEGALIQVSLAFSADDWTSGPGCM